MNCKHLSIFHGHPFRGKIPDTIGGDVTVIQMRSVSPDGIDWVSCVQTHLPESTRSPNWLQDNDILVTAKGQNHQATLIQLEEDTKVLASPQFFILRVTAASLLAPFLCWWINQPPVQRYFEQNSQGSGVKSLNRNVLESMPVVIPTLERQQQIMALSELALRQNHIYQTLIHNNQTLMQGLAQQLANTSEPQGVTP